MNGHISWDFIADIILLRHFKRLIVVILRKLNPGVVIQ